jgi:hypothetical protein
MKAFLKRGRRAGAEADIMAALASILGEEEDLGVLEVRKGGERAWEGTHEDIVVRRIVGYSVDVESVQTHD